MPNSPTRAAPHALAKQRWQWQESASDVSLAAKIFAAAPVALLRLTADLTPVAANDSYRLLLGAQGREEIVDYREFLNEAERSHHDALLAKMAAGQLASFRIELTLHVSSGHVSSGRSAPAQPAQIRAVAVLAGGTALAGNGELPSGFVISLTDVTALRRHAEVEIRRHDALNQALEEMLAGLVLFDSEDRLVFCNRRYRQFYGVPDELARPGTRFIDMLLEEVRSGKLAMTGEEQARFVAARIERRKAQTGQGQTGNGDFAIVEQRNADGQWLQIRERVMPGGWIVGVHVDATALKEKEQALEAHIQDLREMRAELEHRTTELSHLAANLATARDEALGAARTKANFLANMSHELRTPLNAVIGFAEILACGTAGELTPRQAEYLTDIRSSGNHLLSVINDILDISKADAGKIALQEDEIGLADFIDATLRLMSATARGKGLALVAEIPPALANATVTVDVRRFRQVLLNLLSNAIKFTPEGGKIRLSTTAEVSYGPEKGGICITVSDTGIGIGADDLFKVFAPFEQADSSLTRKYEGTGLGLTLVKALIELHQGKVYLDSTPGVGTHVTIWLPPARVKPNDAPGS